MALRMSPLADSTIISSASFEGESTVPAGWEERCLVSSDWRALRRSVGAMGLNLESINECREKTTEGDRPNLCHIDAMKKLLGNYSPRIQNLNFITTPSMTFCNFLILFFTP